MYKLNKIYIILLILGISCTELPKTDVEHFKASDTPQLFGPDWISTSLYERDIAISQDRDEIIWSLGGLDRKRRCLVRSVKRENGWSEKEILPFSGSHDDIEPFISPDGNSLYFASNRPLDEDTTRNDYNIWVSRKMDSGWDEPMALESIINSAADEYYPSISNAGDLYFTSTRPGGVGLEDIYMSKLEEGSFQKIICLDTAINTPGYEFNAFIAQDASYLIFGSFGRPDGMGGGDLYMSRNDPKKGWQKAEHLGNEINSASLDFCPFVIDSFLFFTSDRKNPPPEKYHHPTELSEEVQQILNGLGNIYIVKWTAGKRE